MRSFFFLSFAFANQLGSLCHADVFLNREDFSAELSEQFDETFNSFRNDTPFNTPHFSPVDVGDFRIWSESALNISQRNKIDVPALERPEFNIDGTPVANFGLTLNLHGYIEFKNPITAFGLDYADLNFSNGQRRPGSISFRFPGYSVAPIGDGFFGVTTDIPFTRVQIFGRGFDLFAIDNVTYGTAKVVPEPGTLMLLLAGLTGVPFVMRKRSESAA